MQIVEKPKKIICFEWEENVGGHIFLKYFFSFHFSLIGAVIYFG